MLFVDIMETSVMATDCLSLDSGKRVSSAYLTWSIEGESSTVIPTALAILTQPCQLLQGEQIVWHQWPVFAGDQTLSQHMCSTSAIYLYRKNATRHHQLVWVELSRCLELRGADGIPYLLPLSHPAIESGSFTALHEMQTDSQYWH